MLKKATAKKGTSATSPPKKATSSLSKKDLTKISSETAGKMKGKNAEELEELRLKLLEGLGKSKSKITAHETELSALEADPSVTKSRLDAENKWRSGEIQHYMGKQTSTEAQLSLVNKQLGLETDRPSQASTKGEQKMEKKMIEGNHGDCRLIIHPTPPSI